MATAQLDIDVFEAWLREAWLRPAPFVAGPLPDRSCPLATWIRSESRVPTALVTKEHVIDSVTGRELGKLPAWAKRFVDAIDKTGWPTRGVSADTALEILTRARKKQAV